MRLPLCKNPSAKSFLIGRTNIYYFERFLIIKKNVTALRQAKYYFILFCLWKQNLEVYSANYFISFFCFIAQLSLSDTDRYLFSSQGQQKLSNAQ